MTCCEDLGKEHVWGPPRLTTAEIGPMEGEWIIEQCLNCATGSLRPLDPGIDGVALFIELLRLEGLDPQPEHDN